MVDCVKNVLLLCGSDEDLRYRTSVAHAFWEYGGFNVCFSREDLSCFDAVVCFNGVLS